MKKRNYTLIAGVSLLSIIILSAVFAPLVTSYDPNGQDLLNSLSAPSGIHWLGTDMLGRDVFTRILMVLVLILQSGF